MPYSYSEIKKRLTKLGFKIVRQKGSHVLFNKGNISFPVPKHGGKQISNGVERNILKIIGLNKEEFKNLLKK